MMMFSTNSQLNVRQKNLLSIAISATDAPFSISFTQVHLTEMKADQIWRDRDYVALINKLLDSEIEELYQTKPKRHPLNTANKNNNRLLTKFKQTA